jgi:hypothetical protein
MSKRTTNRRINLSAGKRCKTAFMTMTKLKKNAGAKAVRNSFYPSFSLNSIHVRRDKKKKTERSGMKTACGYKRHSLR